MDRYWLPVPSEIVDCRPRQMFARQRVTQRRNTTTVPREALISSEPGFISEILSHPSYFWWTDSLVHADSPHAHIQQVRKMLYLSGVAQRQLFSIS